MYVVVPMYVGEIAQDGNRGALGCFLPIIVSFGILFGYCVGPYLSIMWFNLISAVPAIIFLGVVFLLPESPYYLLMNNKVAEANRVLYFIRNGTNRELMDNEILSMRKTLKYSQENTSNFKDFFFVPSLRSTTLLIITIMIFQQLTGVSIIIAYMQTVFNDAGIQIPSEIAVIIVGIVQCISCSATPLVVDKLGRKILLLLSIFGTGMSQCTMGIYFYLKTEGNDINAITWLPILSLVVFITAYNIGLGPLPWVLVGELFPQHVKSIASTIATFSCLIMAFSTTVSFPLLREVLGVAWSFWFFSACCVLGFTVLLVFLPETKGKSLYEIQLMLNGNSVGKL